MRTFLRDIKISGVKNIKEPVELTFANKEINSLDELNDNNIKAIYGPNGSGKTALVYGFHILEELLKRPNYLQDSQTTKKLLVLKNKECNKINLAVNFFTENKENKVFIYHYSATIMYEQNTFMLFDELYSYKTSEYGKETVLLQTEKGKVKISAAPQTLMDEFTNLLDKASFNSLLLNRVFIKKNNSKLETLSPFYDPFFMFAASLFTMLDINDTKFDFYLKKPEEYAEAAQDFSDYLTNLHTFREERFNFQRIEEKNLPAYKKELTKKAEFLKIFKPNVKNLSFDKKPVLISDEVKFYDVNEFVEYKNYKIDLELESVGIKKLLTLFDAIKLLNKGTILVIDELDSHINDVYLIRLLDYIANYTKGQLIFTTHNASPMDLLRKKKYGLDFLSISGDLTSWTQIGNYSASKMYHKGMIKKLPFNVSAESFIGVFADDET